MRRVLCGTYINRIYNLGYDGIGTTKEIQDIFRANGLKTEILAASFKNARQVLELAKYGVGAATVAPDVLEDGLKSGAVSAAVETFISDFEQLTGVGQTMADC